jgi:hypothetical protein
MKTHILFGLTLAVVVLSPLPESGLLAQAQERGAIAQGQEPEAEHAVPADLLKAQVAAARKVYELNIMAYKAGIAKGYDLESLCLWSVRWLDAERDLSKKPVDRIAAAEAHLERVKTVEAMAKQLVKGGAAEVRQEVAAEYYRVQAQIWLAQAKGK